MSNNNQDLFSIDEKMGCIEFDVGLITEHFKDSDSGEINLSRHYKGEILKIKIEFDKKKYGSLKGVIHLQLEDSIVNLNPVKHSSLFMLDERNNFKHTVYQLDGLIRDAEIRRGEITKKEKKIDH